jgi:hypothetical protein
VMCWHYSPPVSKSHHLKNTCINNVDLDPPCYYGTRAKTISCSAIQN